MSNSQEFATQGRTMPTDNWLKIGYLLSIGDEKGVAKIIDFRLGNAAHMQQRALLLYMDSFTDKKLLFDLILSVYTNDGYKRSTKHGNHCKYTLFRQGWKRQEVC